MTPGSFDAKTASEMVSDTEARDLATIGRDAADAGAEKAPLAEYPSVGGYWAETMWGFRQSIIDEAFERRKARLERMKK